MTRQISTRFAGIGILTVLLAQPAMAAVVLNRLSACVELRQFRAALDAPEVCHAPAGRIASVLNSRIQSWPGIKLCFRTVAPAASLTGFDCASVKMDSRTESLLCLRDVGTDDIRDYKARYRQVYDPLVKEYLRQASTCDAGNGDASVMAPSMLPWIVTIVAEHDFGFTLPIGNRLVGSSAFVHGFGRLDPEIYAADDRSVEYLYTWRNLP